MDEVENKMLIEWLKHAYVMEKKVLSTLTKHAEDAKDFPEIKQKIEEHMVQTKRHEEDVEKCIRKFDESLPKLEAGAKQVVASLGEMMEMHSEDHQLIRNAILEYSTEYMEIGVYNTIITLAEQSGDDEVLEICNKILTEEIEMADWLEENHSDLVMQMYEEQTQDDTSESEDEDTEE